jgi:hypothetical protein
MTKRILFVGNVDESLSDAAKHYDSNAKLITKENLGSLPEVGYISIGDHDFDDFINVLETYSELHYISSDAWEHESTRIQTETYLKYYSHRKPVYNTKENSYADILKLEDSRKNENQPQLWIVGGAEAHGSGVSDSEKFGCVLSEKLGVDVSYLTQINSSIGWQSDQILRSDIKKNDFVVWCIGSMETISYFDNQIKQSVTLGYRNTHRLDVLEVDENSIVDEHLLHHSITAISRVICHSQILGYKLAISLISNNTAENEQALLLYLSQFENFIHSYLHQQDWIDCGYSGSGDCPGPEHHKYLADLFYCHLTNTSTQV